MKKKMNKTKTKATKKTTQKPLGAPKKLSRTVLYAGVKDSRLKPESMLTTHVWHPTRASAVASFKQFEAHNPKTIARIIVTTYTH